MGNLFTKVRAGNIALGRMLRRDRMGDFRYATSVTDAIFGNLSTTSRGLGRQLTAENARQLAALQRLTARSSQANARAVNRTEGRVASRYGSAIAGAVQPQMGVVRGAAKGATTIVRGQAAAGGIAARGGAAAMDALQAGVAEAQAGAQAQLAQALSYRAKNDAQLIAEKQLALQQMRLQAQLDFQNWKKQQDYLQKLQNTNPDLSGMTAVASSAASAFTGLQTIFNTPTTDTADGSISFPNAAEAASKYIQDNGITDQNEAALIYALSAAMYQAGAGPTTEGQLYGPGHSDAERQKLILNALMTRLAMLYPNFSKYQNELQKAIEAQVAAVAGSLNFSNAQESVHPSVHYPGH
jgi:hypothetical protein